MEPADDRREYVGNAVGSDLINGPRWSPSFIDGSTPQVLDDDPGEEIAAMESAVETAGSELLPEAGIGQDLAAMEPAADRREHAGARAVPCRGWSSRNGSPP